MLALYDAQVEFLKYLVIGMVFFIFFSYLILGACMGSEDVKLLIQRLAKYFDFDAALKYYSPLLLIYLLPVLLTSSRLRTVPLLAPAFSPRRPRFNF